MGLQPIEELTQVKGLGIVSRIRAAKEEFAMRSAIGIILAGLIAYGCLALGAERDEAQKADSEGFRQEEFSIAYWEKILGPADRYKQRHPDPELIQRVWGRITAMPPERAWFLLTQIEWPEQPDLWPVEHALRWADKHVPRENILKSLHALPRIPGPGDGNYWLAGRWASLCVRRCPRKADRVYLEKAIGDWESATPRNGVPRTFDNGVNEFTYIALASLLDQKSGEAFLVAHPGIPLYLGLYELYGIEAVCRALPTMMPNHDAVLYGVTGIGELAGSIQGDRRTRAYQWLCTLRALQPPEGNDNRALMTWMRIKERSWV